ncbi:hypothetical protein N9Y42_03330 [Mariniblastus sp.]|nr:hypothetical protein [Mariniblastus sp.]
MNDSNPFAPASTAAKPVAVVEPNQKTGGRVFEIVHNAFRCLFASFCFGFVPIFIVPFLKNGFEEFGVDLPLLTQLTLQYSKWISWLTLPLIIGAFAAIEFGIFSIRSNLWKTLTNVTYWLALVLVGGSICFSLAIPFVAITTGLTATADLLPHLL